MGEVEALRITTQVKGHFGEVSRLLFELQRREGYLALGYDTFPLYVAGELEMSKAQAYRLVYHGHVLDVVGAALVAALGPEDRAALQSPMGDSPSDLAEIVKISEREARDLKGHLDQVVDHLDQGVRRVGPHASFKSLGDVVDQAVHASRAQLSEPVDALEPRAEPRADAWSTKRVLKALVDLISGRSTLEETRDMWDDSTAEDRSEWAAVVAAALDVLGQLQPPGRTARCGPSPARPAESDL